jgi:hypothetical protein
LNLTHRVKRLSITPTMIASIELAHIAFNNIEVPLDYITGILVVLLPRRSKACCPSIGVALTPAWYCD